MTAKITPDDIERVKINSKLDLENLYQKYSGIADSMDKAMADSFSGFQHSSFKQYMDSTYDETTNSNPEDSLNTNIILVDKRQNSFIGTAQLQHPDIGQGNDGYPYIVNVAVNPDYREQGIGGRLLREIENISREKKYPEVRLTIHFQHLDEFYRENGFQKITDGNRGTSPSPSRETPWFYSKKITAGGKSRKIQNTSRTRTRNTTTKTRITTKNNKTTKKNKLRKKQLRRKRHHSRKHHKHYKHSKLIHT